MQADFRKLGALALALLLFTATFAAAQGVVTGSISGTAVDQKGNVIPNATVTATETGTNTPRATTTNSSGAFRISNLPVGAYTVAIEAANYKQVKISNVAVSSGRESALGSVTMPVGTKGEVVNVEESAQLVESTTSQISTNFGNRKVAELAGIGSGFDALALYVPGVASTGSNGFSNTNGAGLSVNGQRGRSNNFQIDGQSNNDNSVAGPSIFIGNQDVIAEFQVVTNNFSAEYGRNMGSVINYVTKSGTNRFHGTAYEFYLGNWSFSRENQQRSPVFGFCAPGQAAGTATPWSSSCENPSGPTSSGKIARYVENRFGGTLGGPIWRNKAWFFGSVQWDRIRTSGAPSSSGNSITPTPAGITALAAAFPGNAAVNALQTIGPYAFAQGAPSPGTASNVTVSNGVTAVSIPFANVTRNLPSLTNDRQITGRGDWQITSKDRFFARYIYQDTAQTNVTGRAAAGTEVDLPAKDQQIGLDWSRTWTSNFVNQARFSFSRAKFGFEGGTLNQFNCVQSSILNCPSGVSWSGGGTLLAFGLQNNLPQGRLINNTQFQDNATWVHGKHTVKFGGEFDRQRSPNVFLPNINGTFTFSGSAARCALFAGVAGPVGCAFSNFLRNSPLNLGLTDGPPSFNFKEKDLAFYAQDDWKVRDNLTFNIGLRWEWNQQAINLLNKFSVATQTGPTPFWDTTLPLSRTTQAKIPQDLNNFGPNIGFAYTPKFWTKVLGENKTVIRGGFRIAYDPSFYNIFLNVATAAPIVNAGSIATGQVIGGLNYGPGFPAATPTGASLRAAGYLSNIPVGSDPGTRAQTTVTNNFHNPYAEQWSLGIQREINSHIAAEVRYVGNHTVGNFQTINGNPNINFLQANFPALLPPGVTKCTTAGSPGLNRVDCNKSLVRVRGNTAFSNYQGLQNELRFSNWHGFSANFAYTWSKTIDNVSEIFSTFAAGNTVADSQNPFNVNVPERGTSGLSYKHVFTMYFIYDTPWYKSQQGILGKALGGWQLNWAYRYRSGQPFTPAQFIANSSCDNSFQTQFFSSVDNCRPILSSASAPLDSSGQYVAPGSVPGCTSNFVDFNSGACSTPSAVRWIYGDDQAALALGSPFLGVGRNTLRSSSFHNVDMGLFKNTKIAEKVNIQLQFNVRNLWNSQYKGDPDPFIDSGRFDTTNNPFGSFMNNYFNTTGSARTVTLGLRIIF